MPSYNSFMGYDPVNDVTLIVWTNLTISLEESHRPIPSCREYSTGFIRCRRFIRTEQMISPLLERTWRNFSQVPLPKVVALDHQLPMPGAYLNGENRFRPSMTSPGRYCCCSPKGTLMAS
jgi:hypothetical protein